MTPWSSEGWSGVPDSATPNPFGLIQDFTNINGGTYTIDGINVANDAGKSWNLTQLDSYTMRFEIRSGDVWSSAGGSYSDPSSVERAELSFAPLYNEGDVLNWEAIVTVLAGPAMTSNFFNLVQLHASTNVNPTYAPFSIQIQEATEKLLIVLQEPLNGFNPVYVGPSAIVRGEAMDIKAKVKMGPTGAGTVFVTLNGSTIVNFSGNVGATASTYYWKNGLYRASAAETMKVDFSHMHMYMG